MYNEHLDDLQSEALNKIEKLFGGNATKEEIVARASMELTRLNASLMEYFHQERYGKPLVSKSSAQDYVFKALMWASLLIYAFDLEGPDEDELQEFEDNFEPEIVVDGMLACMSVQFALCNLAYDHYVDNVEPEEIEEHVMMMLAPLSILAKRLGMSFIEALNAGTL